MSVTMPPLGEHRERDQQQRAGEQVDDLRVSAFSGSQQQVHEQRQHAQQERGGEELARGRCASSPTSSR
jgi:hypothetical protein